MKEKLAVCVNSKKEISSFLLNSTWFILSLNVTDKDFPVEISESVHSIYASVCLTEVLLSVCLIRCDMPLGVKVSWESLLITCVRNSVRIRR